MESEFNLHRFRVARNDATKPYPTSQEVYHRSDTSHPESNFADLGLSDFFVVNRRVARRKLELLSLESYQVGLLSRGVQPQMDRREPYNMVLEASIGYTGSVGVMVMDEVAGVNERLESVDEKLEELNGRVITDLDVNEAFRNHVRDLERDLAVEREARRTLSRTLGEYRTLTDGLVEEVGRLRDDLGRLTADVGRRFVDLRQRERAVMGCAEVRAPTPGPSRRVPIVDEVVPETIDLTDDSDDSGPSGPSTSSESVVIDVDAMEEPDVIRDPIHEVPQGIHDPVPEYPEPPSYTE